MNKTMLYMAAGEVEIIYLAEFVKRIPIENIDRDRLSVSFEQPLMGQITDGALTTWHENAVSKKDYELLPFFSLNSSQMVTMWNNRIEDQVNQEMLKAMNKEIQILVAQKNPEFFLKDLNLKALDDLGIKFAERFGGGHICGVHVMMSKYQKFLFIAEPEDFRYFMGRVQTVQGDIQYRGKLVLLRPDKLVMGRFENLEYLKELSSKQMFMAGTYNEPTREDE